MQIKLNKKEIKEFEKFKASEYAKKTEPNPGCHFSIEAFFGPIGTMLIAKSWLGNEKDITDYSTW